MNYNSIELFSNINEYSNNYVFVFYEKLRDILVDRNKQRHILLLVISFLDKINRFFELDVWNQILFQWDTWRFSCELERLKTIYSFIDLDFRNAIAKWIRVAMYFLLKIPWSWLIEFKLNFLVSLSVIL